MTDSDANREHAPSARRRQEARAQGHVARSREFVFALMYAAWGAALVAIGPALLSTLGERLRGDIHRAAQPLDNPLDHLQQYIVQFGWWLMPWLVVLPVVVVLAHWIQHGPLWLPARIAWDFGRVDPMRGAQRLFRVRSLAGLILGILKICLFTGLAVWFLREHWTRLLLLTMIPGPTWAPTVARLLFGLGAWLGVGLLIWGGIDFAWQLYQHERDLRMSPEEVREDIQAIQARSGLRSDGGTKVLRRENEGSPKSG